MCDIETQPPTFFISSQLGFTRVVHLISIYDNSFTGPSGLTGHLKAFCPSHVWCSSTWETQLVLLGLMYSFIIRCNSNTLWGSSPFGVVHSRSSEHLHSDFDVDRNETTWKGFDFNSQLNTGCEWPSWCSEECGFRGHLLPRVLKIQREFWLCQGKLDETAGVPVGAVTRPPQKCVYTFADAYLDFTRLFPRDFDTMTNWRYRCKKHYISPQGSLREAVGNVW